MAERIRLVERGIGLHEPITTEMLERRMDGEDVRMTESMVECVARASFAWWKEQNSRAANFEDMNPDELEFALGHARVVIAAMREPTEGMLNAVDLRKERMMGSGYAWQAMIDAALKP